VARAAISTELKYQPALDGVRAFAVLAVVAWHARGQWFPGGYIGVDIFFVLSGFLITTILLAERERTGRISVGSFYLRRALRLFPALFLMCAVVAVALLLLPGIAERSATLLGVLTAVTYTSSLVAAAGSSETLGWMIPTWSLSVEEYFYLLWPFALLAATSKRARHLRSVILAVAALAVAYRFLAPPLFGWNLQRVVYAADTRAEQLLIGCLLAVLLRASRRSVPTWVAMTVGGILTAFVVMPKTLTEDWYPAVGSTIVAVLAAVLIAGLAQEPTRLPGRLLSLKPLVWVGQRSYGIYLWNLPIVGFVAATTLSDDVQLATKLALTFLIPAISYRWVEIPFRRLKRHRADRERDTSPNFGEEPNLVDSISATSDLALQGEGSSTSAVIRMQGRGRNTLPSATD
jgi:peptidoglycan/LPS O-acetylase OafA/YrhL